MVAKPRNLRKVSLITIPAKNLIERRQRRKFQFKMWEENPRELFRQSGRD